MRLLIVAALIAGSFMAGQVLGRVTYGPAKFQDRWSPVAQSCHTEPGRNGTVCIAD